MLPKSNPRIQTRVRRADGRGMKNTRQMHRDLVAGLQSLDQVERGLQTLPASERNLAMDLLVGLRDMMSTHIDHLAGELESEAAVMQPEDGFTDRVKAGLHGMARTARLRGIRITGQFAPSLRTVPFSAGGSILLGLVEQALSAPVASASERNVAVTAAVDAQDRLVISIEDSAQAGRESYSIRDLGRWRQRIGELGGELRLRGVPFGHGTTIQATLPVAKQAA